MKRLMPGSLVAGVVLVNTCYAYNTGPVGVVVGILAILLLLSLFGWPSLPDRPVGGAWSVSASLGPPRREQPVERTEPRLPVWPSQGLVRGGIAMLVTRQIYGNRAKC